MEETLIDIATPLANAVSGNPGVVETIFLSIPWAVVSLTYIFIFADMFYGFVVSLILREARSHKMLKGLYSKMFVLFAPIFGIILKAFFVVCSLPSGWVATKTLTDMFGVSVLSEFPICFLICAFVLLMEFVSFIETSAKIDKRARKLLKVIQRSAEDKVPEKHKKIVEDVFDADEDMQSASS